MIVAPGKKAILKSNNKVMARLLFVKNEPSQGGDQFSKVIYAQPRINGYTAVNFIGGFANLNLMYIYSHGVAGPTEEARLIMCPTSNQ